MAKEGEVRLELWIKSASNLVNRDFGSKSDPYVLFLVNSREACRTKVIKVFFSLLLCFLFFSLSMKILFNKIESFCQSEAVFPLFSF